MHAEYKEINEKLVVVDYDLENNQIKNISISGDFFVYPDDDFFNIAKSLNGVSLSLSLNDIETIIKCSLTKNTVMIGISPLSIAKTIKMASAS